LFIEKVDRTVYHTQLDKTFQFNHFFGVLDEYLHINCGLSSQIKVKTNRVALTKVDSLFFRDFFVT